MHTCLSGLAHVCNHGQSNPRSVGLHAGWDVVHSQVEWLIGGPIVNPVELQQVCSNVIHTRANFDLVEIFSNAGTVSILAVSVSGTLPNQSHQEREPSRSS